MFPLPDAGGPIFAPVQASVRACEVWSLGDWSSRYGQLEASMPRALFISAQIAASWMPVPWLPFP